MPAPNQQDFYLLVTIFICSTFGLVLCTGLLVLILLNGKSGLGWIDPSFPACQTYFTLKYSSMQKNHLAAFLCLLLSISVEFGQFIFSLYNIVKTSTQKNRNCLVIPKQNMSAFYCLQALSIVLLIPPFVLQISLKVEQSACQSNLQSYSNLIVVSLGLTSLIVSLAAIIYLNVKQRNTDQIFFNGQNVQGEEDDMLRYMEMTGRQYHSNLSKDKEILSGLLDKRQGGSFAMKEALISAFPQQQNLPPEQIERNENVLYIEEEDSIGSASFKYAEYQPPLHSEKSHSFEAQNRKQSMEQQQDLTAIQKKTIKGLLSQGFEIVADNKDKMLMVCEYNTKDGDIKYKASISFQKLSAKGEQEEFGLANVNTEMQNGDIPSPQDAEKNKQRQYQAGQKKKERVIECPIAKFIQRDQSIASIQKQQHKYKDSLNSAKPVESVQVLEFYHKRKEDKANLGGQNQYNYQAYVVAKRRKLFPEQFLQEELVKNQDGKESPIKYVKKKLVDTIRSKCAL